MTVKKILYMFIVNLFFLPIFIFQITNFCVSNASKEFELLDCCKSFVLADLNSGDVLIEKNYDEKLPIASITKIMTMLILAEKIDSGEIKLDEIVETSEHAKSTIGSKIFLEVGEKLTVENMLYAVAVASANDAAAAIAEHIAGSEDNFVILMNKKADELNLKNTHFSDAYGLDDKNNFSTAGDIVLIAKELLTKHNWITKYTKCEKLKLSMQRDDREFVNTNKLIKSYKGCTGLKTGTTDAAGFCLCCTASRNNMNLVAICLGAKSTEKMKGDLVRHEICKKLLEYGFSNYKPLEFGKNDEEIFQTEIEKGTKSTICVKTDLQGLTLPLVRKGEAYNLEKSVVLNQNITAPIRTGDQLGETVYSLGGKKLLSAPIVACEDVERMDFMFLFMAILKNFFAGINLV